MRDDFSPEEIEDLELDLYDDYDSWRRASELKTIGCLLLIIALVIIVFATGIVQVVR